MGKTKISEVNMPLEQMGLRKMFKNKGGIIMTSRSLAWTTGRCQVSDKRNSVGKVRNAEKKGRREGGRNRERERREGGRERCGPRNPRDHKDWKWSKL